MIKIYADGADIKSILEFNKDPKIAGFTTNPSLMAKAGLKDYEAFAKEVLAGVKKKPISFEVFADEYDEMYRQANKIASWAENVYVKIPVTNTKGVGNYFLMEKLSKGKIKINATAITTHEQIKKTIDALNTGTPSIISIFAGRIADTGVDPVGYIHYGVSNKVEGQEVLWASTREVYNYIQARDIGADIITITNDVLKKLKELWDRPLEQVSLDTVRMFFKDAQETGFSL